MSRHSTTRRGGGRSSNGDADEPERGSDPRVWPSRLSPSRSVTPGLSRHIFLLLLCFLGLVRVCQGADQVDFLAGRARAAEMRLFKNPTQFAKHTFELFDQIKAEQMSDMLQHILSRGWLPQLAAMVSNAELAALFQIRSLPLVSASMPLINLVSDERLESLPAAAWQLIWEVSSEGNAVPFEGARLAAMESTRQTVLLPRLPIGLRASLSASVLLHWVKQARCDMLPLTVLLTKNMELARHLDGACTAKLHRRDLPPITLDSAMFKVLPTDALERVPSSKLTPRTYTQISANHLASHLVHTTPSASQLKSIPGPTLSRAIELIVSRPADCALLSPNLLSVLPISLMKHFGERFWAHADPTSVWSLSGSHLTHLPPTAWAAVHPAILRNMIINSKTFTDRIHQRVSDLVARMGTGVREDGEHSCSSPRNWLQYVAPIHLARLTETCVGAMEPRTMAVFSTASRLNALSEAAVGALTASHVTNIPVAALTDVAQPFLARLMNQASRHYKAAELDRVACAGLRPEHLQSLRSLASWELFNYECFSVLPAPALAAIPARSFRRLQSSLFRKIPMALDEGAISGEETMHMFFGKIGKEQLTQIGEDIVTDDRLHPCHELVLSWRAIGEGDESTAQGTVDGHIIRGCNSVAQSMPTRCFSLLDARSYGEIGKGCLSTMADNILTLVKEPARFAAIPPTALEGLRPVQARHLAKDVLSAATVEHLVALGKNKLTLELDPTHWASLPMDVFVEAVNRGVPLPETVLAAFPIASFYDSGQWIETVVDKLSARQWNHLGTADGEKGGKGDGKETRTTDMRPPQLHPCAYISYAHVKLRPSPQRENNERAPVQRGASFWKGINAQCMASLSFIDKIETSELELVPDTAFSLLNHHQRELLAAKMGNRLHRLEYAVNCGEYPPEEFAALANYQYELLTRTCYQNLSPEVWGAFPPTKVPHLPVKAFKLLSAEQVAALKPEFLTALSPAQLAAISIGYRGLGCAGFRQEQRMHVSLEHLAPSCFHNLDPASLRTLTGKEFARIPLIFWAEAISREQVAALPAELFAGLTLEMAHHIGSKWRASPTLHPLKGFTKPQLEAMSMAVREAILKARAQLPPDASSLVERSQRSSSILLLTLSAILVILGLSASISTFYVYYYRSRCGRGSDNIMQTSATGHHSSLAP